MKENAIFQLIQKALFHSETDSFPDSIDLDWNTIFEELQNQTVSGIPADLVLKQVSLPSEVKNKWVQYRMHQVGFFYQLIHMQNELVQLMKANGISIAILKGLSAAAYYPNPTARTMGDIDFLVNKTDLQKAHRIMLDNGYQMLYEEDHVDYHYTLEKDRFYFEMHWKPAGMPEGETGVYLDKFFDKGMKQLKSVQIDDYQIPVLPELQNGLVLLLHIVKHLKSGLGLRQIIDWMMYVQKELSDDFWYSSMKPVLQNTGYM